MRGRYGYIGKALLAACFALAISFILPFSQLDAKTLYSESFTLPNGLQVVVIPNHKVPAVSHMLWYKMGGMDELPGKSGIAHFLEHLMYKGTKKIKPGEFSAIIARNGGNENAFTSQDFTAYFQNIAVEKLPIAMELEADRMVNLSLSDDEVDRERKVIIEERRTRTDNDPQALLAEQMQAALYLNHPYHKPLIGWLHEMQALTREDAENFYRQYYAPNNAVLIVAGDITAEQLKPMVNKYYGPIPRRDIPKHIIPQEPKQKTERRVTLKDSRVTKPELLRYYLAPTQTTGESKYAYALVLLSQILGEGNTSRLDKSLVVEKKLAASVATYYDELGRGEGKFGFYLVPKEGVTLETIEKAMDEIIQTLLKDGITDDELEHAKKYLVAETIYAQEGFRSMAYAYGQALTTGMTTDYVENWSDTISKVTKEEVEGAARYVLQPRKSVTGLLLSDKGE